MSSASFIFVISAAIVGILVARAVYIVRTERHDTARGCEPGKGDHIIHAEYSSGLSGHSTSYKIPRDPEAYARRFVPRSKGKS
ncbi:MAG: hypothetical protein AAGA47_04120 [Pseudomonadota bacterium]